MSNDSTSSTNTRRDFIKKSTILVAGSTVAGNLQVARAAHAYGDEVIAAKILPDLLDIRGLRDTQMSGITE